MSILENAIKKYSSGDEAYALKLKENIRNAMGYSNYMARLGKETAAPAAMVPFKGDITPQGVLAGQETGYGMQKTRMGSLERIAGAFDTAAGQIASEQIAASKRASENPFAFEPQDWLDKQIMQFVNSQPKNEDGSDMTIDQFKTQLFGKVMGEGDASNVLFQPGLNEDVINKRIEQRIPKDFQEKSVYYQALSLGRTKAEAKELQDYENYKTGRMDPGVKEVYDALNPSWAIENNVKMQAKERDEVNGVTKPKYTIDEIVNNNPGITRERAKFIVQGEVQRDVKEDVVSEFKEEYDKSTKILAKGGNWSEIADSDDYKKVINNIAPAYADYFTKAEIENLIYKIFNNQL